MKEEIHFRIVLEKPTNSVDFGLQKGSGSRYQTVQTQRSSGLNLRFDFTVQLKSGNDDVVDFAGLFVQGNRGNRFIYVDIGACAGQFDCPWSRRLKIPMTGITRAMIERAKSKNDGAFATTVPGTGKDGGPNCATVKPFAGWTLIDR